MFCHFESRSVTFTFSITVTKNYTIDERNPDYVHGMAILDLEFNEDDDKILGCQLSKET